MVLVSNKYITHLQDWLLAIREKLVKDHANVCDLSDYKNDGNGSSSGKEDVFDFKHGCPISLLGVIWMKFTQTSSSENGTH